MRNRTTQLQPPKTTHLGWLYLLAVVPGILGLIEQGGLPASPRNTIAEIVMTAFVLVVVNVIIHRSKLLAAQMRAHLASNVQLQHSNRLATIGQLAAGVAHELGSPLQVIVGRAKMIATGESLDDEAKEAGKIIHVQAQRMADIISGLLGFARRRSPQRTTANVGAIARDVHRMLVPIAKKKAIVLELDVPPIALDGVIKIDTQQVQQALTNLVMNAIQAVPEFGHVAIAIGRRIEHPPDHSGLIRLGSAQDVTCLQVTDDGPGIEPRHLSHVFEPFFTTKDVGEGTGLGLAVAHGLVRDNGGWITVESELGHGACFSMYFPCDGGR
ncbi:MAG: ATP-binding protein [Kofleriaceae bacterium]